MSEVKLDLLDSQQILSGTIHGSIVDSCVAALSAEPETISELEHALARYIKPLNADGHFASFRCTSEIDNEPWDAGIVIIDLMARIVASESIFSHLQAEGEVWYHDGGKATDYAILYRLSDEWMFLNSLNEYYARRASRAQEHSKPKVDVREILFGRPLLEFIVQEISASPSAVCNAGKLLAIEQAKLASAFPPLPARGVRESNAAVENQTEPQTPAEEEEELFEILNAEISAVHARWLLTPRADLLGQTPRQVLLAKHEFVDFELHTRELQWSLLGEGPPCLPKDAFAYRFGGFGTHECVIYYHLVRYLLWSALENRSAAEPNDNFDGAGVIAWLESIKHAWLENPAPDFDGRVPAIIIDNERRRLPCALTPRDFIIDEDCDLCRLSRAQVEMGGVGFWHLDGSSMDDEFAFSFHATFEEWEQEIRRREEFNEQFNREWHEQEQRRARVEQRDEVVEYSDDSTTAA